MKKIIMIFILLISIKIIADTVNTNKLIIDKKINNIGRKLVPSLKYNAKEKANENLWIITSEIINKTIEFYENKIKAKAKIKQLMELKSIGLLGRQLWRDLGFFSYENDAKSEIKVKELLLNYDIIKERFLSYLTSNSSKEIFEKIGLNSLFLAKLLKGLDLQMINGKILNKYNAVYVKRLLALGDGELKSYKQELLEKKDKLILELSSSRKDLLKKFFEMSVAIKLLNVLKTNGFKKTIPEFKQWLEKQSNGLLKEFYSGFSDEYLAIIEKTLNSVPEGLKPIILNNDPLAILTISKEEKEKLFIELETSVSVIRKQLSDKYIELFYQINQKVESLDEISYDYVYKKYDELEIIEIITNQETGIDLENENIKKAQLIIDLKEIDVLDFEYRVLNTPNLLYTSKKTYIIYLIFTKKMKLIQLNQF